MSDGKVAISLDSVEGGRWIALAVRRGAVGSVSAASLELSDMGDGAPTWGMVVECSIVQGQSVLCRLARLLHQDEGGA